jgi:putative tryptophan/tyrosine transport system substrate-binding protein
VDAASRLGIELTMRTVARLGPTEYKAALVAMRSEGVAGVLVAASQAWASDAALVGRIAQDLGLPTICEWEYLARDGCMLGYGHDLAYAQRRIGEYAVRILKGTTPAELPVEQSDAWKLTVNRAAFARLGIDLPALVIARAEEVID